MINQKQNSVMVTQEPHEFQSSRFDSSFCYSHQPENMARGCKAGMLSCHVQNACPGDIHNCGVMLRIMSRGQTVKGANHTSSVNNQQKSKDMQMAIHIEYTDLQPSKTNENTFFVDQGVKQFLTAFKCAGFVCQLPAPNQTRLI